MCSVDLNLIQTEKLSLTSISSTKTNVKQCDRIPQPRPTKPNKTKTKTYLLLLELLNRITLLHVSHQIRQTIKCRQKTRVNFYRENKNNEQISDVRHFRLVNVESEVARFQNGPLRLRCSLGFLGLNVCFEAGKCQKREISFIKYNPNLQEQNRKDKAIHISTLLNILQLNIDNYSGFRKFSALI